MLLQNTSFFICNNSEYLVHGLFKLIQNYVNNKTNNYYFLVSQPCVSIDYVYEQRFQSRVLLKMPASSLSMEEFGVDIQK